MRSHSGVGDDENVDVDPDINPDSWLTRSMVSHSVHHRHDFSRLSEQRKR